MSYLFGFAKTTLWHGTGTVRLVSNFPFAFRENERGDLRIQVSSSKHAAAAESGRVAAAKASDDDERNEMNSVVVVGVESVEPTKSSQDSDSGQTRGVAAWDQNENGALYACYRFVVLSKPKSYFVQCFPDVDL